MGLTINKESTTTYCKFGNCRENFILANSSVNGNICHVKSSRLGFDLHVPTSVIDRVISLFREGFISAKLRLICEVS